jgi:Domain of unknown function (DUF4268)
MFSREEASRIKEDFWTTFGRYMSPIPSAEGLQINWVNYHTGLKDVYFRMDTAPRSAIISISMEHRDPGIQELYYEQFLELKTMLHTMVNEEWTWKLHEQVGNGKTVSRIYNEIPGVSVFNKDQWSELISFFKPRIIALDAFWENAKYSFEELK